MPHVDIAETGQQVRLGEADGPTRRRILLITPGQGSSGYYPAQVLERDGPQVIVAGTHMYVDHPGRTESQDRPERSIRDLAAILESDAVWDPQGSDGPGLYATATIVPSMCGLIDELAEHIGVSIRGVGESDRDGTITRLTAVESVDFVTRAGRGGKVLDLLESVRVAEALTANELRDAVGDAVRERWGDDDTHVYIQDYSVDDGWVVFEQYSNDDESFWRATLTVDGDAVTVADDAVQVERDITWTVVDDVTEALREARTAVREARNVGQWFESLIHLDFTRRADEMASEGRLTRDERIALSHAIGDALAAFETALTDGAPHLYDRDPYQTPEDQPPSTTTTTEEADMPTIEELQTQLDEATRRAEEAEAARDAAQATIAREALGRAARDRARHVIDESDVELPAPAQTRVIETAVSGDLPTGTDGQLDQARFDQTVTEAITAEQTYLQEAAGITPGGPARVTGLGHTPPSGDTPNFRAEDDYRNAGLSEAAAKVAAVRPL